MSAREGNGKWVVSCDAECSCGLCRTGTARLWCCEAIGGPTLIAATSHATRAGWVTRPVTVDIDGVPRQRVEHYCPAHKGVAG